MFKDLKEWNKWALLSICLVIISFALPLWSVSYTESTTNTTYLTTDVYIDGITQTTNILGKEIVVDETFSELEESNDDAPSQLSTLTAVLQFTIVGGVIMGFLWATVDDNFVYKKYLALGTIGCFGFSIIYFYYVWGQYLTAIDMRFFFEKGANLDLATMVISGNPSWGLFGLFGGMGLAFYSMKSDIKAIFNKLMGKNEDEKILGLN